MLSTPDILDTHPDLETLIEFKHFGGKKSFEPKSGSFKWAKVQIDNVSQWQKRKIYILGKSVKYDDKYYLSTGLIPFKIKSKFILLCLESYSPTILHPGY